MPRAQLVDALRAASSAQILHCWFFQTNIKINEFSLRPHGPMDKASAYGAGDCRFESCRGHCMRVSDMCSFSRKTRKSGEPNTRHTQRCQLTTLPPLPGRGIHVYIKISGSLNDHHTSAEIPPPTNHVYRPQSARLPLHTCMHTCPV